VNTDPVYELDPDLGSSIKTFANSIPGLLSNLGNIVTPSKLIKDTAVPVTLTDRLSHPSVPTLSRSDVQVVDPGSRFELEVSQVRHDLSVRHHAEAFGRELQLQPTRRCVISFSGVSLNE
jgi:hypothetical protein